VDPQGNGICHALVLVKLADTVFADVEVEGFTTDDLPW
jgi:hypothetical protein